MTAIRAQGGTGEDLPDVVQPCAKRRTYRGARVAVLCQSQCVRIEILGTPTVTGRAGTVTGASLGGRRAQVALVALALEPSGVTSDRLAEMIWAGTGPRSTPPARLPG